MQLAETTRYQLASQLKGGDQFAFRTNDKKFLCGLLNCCWDFVLT